MKICRACVAVLLLTACRAPARVGGVAAPSSAAAPIAVGAPAQSPPPTGADRAAARYEAFALPAATGPASVDYFAYEPGRRRVWVPIADSGGVAVFDVAARTFERVEGFETVSREVHGKQRLVGPTAAAVGDGVVYVGNRATNEVCAVDAASLKLGSCVAVGAPIDGVAYVAKSREVWVTTPHDSALVVLDASEPALLVKKTVIKVDGQPEGYGADDARGVFFTNVEDKDRTLEIDVATHAVRSTWEPGCGGDGPRGLAVDAKNGFVVVACTDHLQVLDPAHAGARLGRLDTGAGVDNIEFAASPRLVVVAAGKAARFTFARLDDRGGLTSVESLATVDGARCAVVDVQGTAFVADPKGARLLVVAAPR